MRRNQSAHPQKIVLYSMYRVSRVWKSGADHLYINISSLGGVIETRLFGSIVVSWLRSKNQFPANKIDTEHTCIKNLVSNHYSVCTTHKCFFDRISNISNWTFYAHLNFFANSSNYFHCYCLSHSFQFLLPFKGFWMFLKMKVLFVPKKIVFASTVYSNFAFPLELDSLYQSVQYILGARSHRHVCLSTICIKV